MLVTHLAILAFSPLNILLGHSDNLGRKKKAIEANICTRKREKMCTDLLAIISHYVIWVE